MSWMHKERPSFIEPPLQPGLMYLDGDQLADRYRQERLRGKTIPLMTYPSGLKRELLTLHNRPAVRLFDKVALHLDQDAEQAFEATNTLAKALGHGVKSVTPEAFEVWQVGSGGRYRVTCDNETGQVGNISYVPGEPNGLLSPRPMELLDGLSEVLLPPLYANEDVGLDAVAPVKFFTPDTQWTWYPTEYDGEDIFFGLVSGYVVEIGYFTLTELLQERGPMGLKIERDLHYRPQTLRELQSLHFT